jgi:hypothetical protein
MRKGRRWLAGPETGWLSPTDTRGRPPQTETAEKVDGIDVSPYSSVEHLT